MKNKRSTRKDFEAKAVAIIDAHPSRSSDLLAAVTRALITAFQRGRRVGARQAEEKYMESERDRPRHFGAPC